MGLTMTTLQRQQLLVVHFVINFSKRGRVASKVFGQSLSIDGRGRMSCLGFRKQLRDFCGGGSHRDGHAPDDNGHLEARDLKASCVAAAGTSHTFLGDDFTTWLPCQRAMTLRAQEASCAAVTLDPTYWDSSAC